MIISNSQQDIKIDLPGRTTNTIIKINGRPDHVKNVGIKISGGADSAIVAYMLALYKKNYRPDISLNLITTLAETKPFQIEFSKRVAEKITDLLDIPFDNHYTNISRAGFDYIAEQKDLQDRLYSEGLIDVHFMGMTANPPDHVLTEYGFSPEDTAHTIERTRKSVPHPVRIGRSYKPLINIDKKGVAELYNSLGVMDSLFPLTRSCEDITTDFSSHCGKCWWCKERMWGFGRLV